MSEHIVTHRKRDLVILHAAVSEALQFNTSLCLFTSHQRKSEMLRQPRAKSYWHWFQCSSFMWEGCGDLLVKAPWQTLKTWVQPCNTDVVFPLPFPCVWPKCKRIPGHWGVRWWLPGWCLWPFPLQRWLLKPACVCWWAVWYFSSCQKNCFDRNLHVPSGKRAIIRLFFTCSSSGCWDHI